MRANLTGIAGNAVAIDALARLALEARRHGCQVRLLGATAELRALVELVGLGEVLLGERWAVRRYRRQSHGSARPVRLGGSGLELEGQLKKREQRLSIEKERHLGDLAPFDLEHL